MENVTIGAALVSVDGAVSLFAASRGLSYSEYMHGDDVWRTVFGSTFSLDYALMFDVESHEYTLKWAVSNSERYVWGYGEDKYDTCAKVVDRVMDIVVDGEWGVDDDDDEPYFEEYDGPVALDTIMDELSR